LFPIIFGGRHTGGSDRENFRKRLMARQKVADFLVCDQTFQVIAVVECDGMSHDGEKDRKRMRSPKKQTL
jgi:very-short-patch-repair endonuclease